MGSESADVSCCRNGLHLLLEESLSSSLSHVMDESNWQDLELKHQDIVLYQRGGSTIDADVPTLTLTSFTLFVHSFHHDISSGMSLVV